MITEIRNLFLKDCLLVIDHFMRPRKLTCYLCLSVVIDEDIRWLDISYFLALLVEDGSRLD